MWDVDAMLASMSSHMLTEWMAYYQVEPFGDELIDIHFAQLRSHILNVNLKKGAAQIDPNKLRLWREIKQFDAQNFFDKLKGAFK